MTPADCTGGEPEYSSVDATLRRNIELWDRLAEVLESSFPIEELALERLFAPGQRVLDYGCGTGRVMAALHRLGIAHVTGCDPAQAMCRLARRNNPGNEVLCLDDPFRAPFGASSFDGVVLVAVLSSVVPESNRSRLIQEAHRLLRPEGTLLVADFAASDNPPYPARYRAAILEPYTFETEDGLQIHHFNRDELQRLVSPHFEVRSLREVSARTVHRRALPGYVLVALR